jgi:hypothetical protein
MKTPSSTLLLALSAVVTAAAASAQENAAQKEAACSAVCLKANTPCDSSVWAGLTDLFPDANGNPRILRNECVIFHGIPRRGSPAAPSPVVTQVSLGQQLNTSVNKSITNANTAALNFFQTSAVPQVPSEEVQPVKIVQSAPSQGPNRAKATPVPPIMSPKAATLSQQSPTSVKLDIFKVPRLAPAKVAKVYIPTAEYDDMRSYVLQKIVDIKNKFIFMVKAPAVPQLQVIGPLATIPTNNKPAPTVQDIPRSALNTYVPNNKPAPTVQKIPEFPNAGQ